VAALTSHGQKKSRQEKYKSNTEKSILYVSRGVLGLLDWTLGGLAPGLPRPAPTAPVAVC